MCKELKQKYKKCIWISHLFLIEQNEMGNMESITNDFKA